MTARPVNLDRRIRATFDRLRRRVDAILPGPYEPPRTPDTDQAELDRMEALVTRLETCWAEHDAAQMPPEVRRAVVRSLLSEITSGLVTLEQSQPDSQRDGGQP